MSHWAHLLSPASHLLDEMRQALLDGPRPGERHATPQHEAFALGLGLRPSRQDPDRRA